MNIFHRPSGLLRATAAALSVFSITAQAFNFTSVPSPNLDLTNLGRVAVVGDFDSISTYQYVQQSQNGYSTNGSQSLLGRYPDGSFANLAVSDGNIAAMCPLIAKDGTLTGIVVGGNFTSLGGVQAQGVALFNPNTSVITPLPGLSGSVASVYCDSDSHITYIGGSFTAGNSTNAMAWVTGWTNLPFAGFNGPVTSITKISNGNIIFGGQFDGLGNTTTPKEQNGQAINIGSSNVTASASTTTSGFDDPSNIVCKDFTQQGSGQTWLLTDNSYGFWDAKFGFGFNPTLLRLYNTDYEGRGTQTFRMIALPDTGIMNLTYTDTSGNRQYCSASCPLPEGNTTAQDFTLVNPIGMNEVRIEIIAWYGSGGGLNGIELFEDDIYSYAVPSFNEPSCSSSSTGANATSTGTWVLTPSIQSTADYLTASIDSGTITPSVAEVVFTPNIQQSGNYSVTMYTPGCIPDDTCSTRGSANITGILTSGGDPFSAIVTQTNNYDKYDEIYNGYIDATSSSFKPTITLGPQSGQQAPLTLVAQKIRFELMSSTGGLNGIFEYNPNEATVDTDFSTSTIDTAGTTLDTGASVSALAVIGDSLYVGGNFTSTSGSTEIRNIFSINGNTTASLPSEGLNDVVNTIYQNGSLLYVGGNFTSTGDNKITGLNGIAIFDETSNSWATMGAGVNGSVTAIVPLQVNVTTGNLEDAIAVSGSFAAVNSYAQNTSFSADGIAIWVPSAKNWLHNLQNNGFTLSGHIAAETNIPNSAPLYAGSVSSQFMGQSDSVALSGNGLPSLVPLGVSITGNSTSSAQSGNDYSGAVTGLFVDSGSTNVTALGGHFNATASDGSTISNFALVTGGSSASVVGLPSTIQSNSTILAMDTIGTTLFMGGQVAGTVGDNTVNGFLVYNIANQQLAGTQPPALVGGSVSVNSVVVQPGSTNVYVGGNFSTAGSLSCASLCVWNSNTNQWQAPATGLSGVVNAMLWASDTHLILAGNLTASGNHTTMLNYDSKTQALSTFTGADGLPGPVTSLTTASSDYTQFWVSGIASNGSTYLQKYNGQTWIPVSGFGDDTQIRDVQVISTTSAHATSSLLGNTELLLLTGNIDVPNFGNASAVLFNGTTFQPFLLSNRDGNGQGSIGKLFVQNPGNFLSSSAHHLARGFVVLIALAIALALIFLLVVAGILMERYRRKREGYAPVKQLSPDQQANLGRIPPERLFGTLGEKSPATPKI